MAAHVFRGICCPSCSNYALKKTVADDVKKYGNEASAIVKINFYVYEMLKSFPAVKTTGDMANKVRSPCLQGGFSLRKFTSNDVDTLKIIPNDLRKDGIKISEAWKLY